MHDAQQIARSTIEESSTWGACPTPSVDVLDPFESMEAALRSPLDDRALQQARDDLRAMMASAQEAGRDDVAELNGMLIRLVAVARCLLETHSDAAEVPAGIIDLLRQGIGAVRAAVSDDSDGGPRIGELMTTAHEQWGDYLCLVDDSPLAATGAMSSGQTMAPENASSDPPLRDDLEAPCAEEVRALLAALALSSEPVELEDEHEHEGELPGEFPAKVERRPAGDIMEHVELEGELLEAYLDDARRCLGGIEAAVLEYEADDTNPQPLQRICRELHTLKRASASVGLAGLASYLHEIEDQLQNHLQAKSPPADVQMLFDCVDQVRQRIVALSGGGDRVRWPLRSPPGRRANRRQPRSPCHTSRNRRTRASSRCGSAPPSWIACWTCWPSWSCCGTAAIRG